MKLTEGGAGAGATGRKMGVFNDSCCCGGIALEFDCRRWLGCR